MTPPVPRADSPRLAAFASPTRRRRPGEARVALDLFRAAYGGIEKLERRQQQRLNALVACARAHSPLYQELYRHLPEGVPALLDLPRVRKPELMCEFDRWVSDPDVTRRGVDGFVADTARIGEPYLGRYFVCTSSGTTGDPGVFVHDEQAVEVCRALALRLDATWLSLRQWTGIAEKRARWAAVVGTGAHFGGVAWMEAERRRSRWRRRAYRVFSVQQPLGSLVAVLDAFDPAILTGYPSALVQLADEQAAGRLYLHPTLVEITGESATADERSRLASLGGALHEAYACSEFQVVAIDCTHGWLHVMSDWVVLEPVDHEGQPTPAGTPSHTVLLTNLANRVQPLLRYDLGDSILVRPDPCPCGNPMPAIRVAGRRDDMLYLATPGGRTVATPPLAISAVMEPVLGVHRSQLVQTSPTSLRVRLEPAPGLSVADVWPELAGRLAEYFTDHGITHVDITPADEPPRRSPGSGKFRQVLATPLAGSTCPRGTCRPWGRRSRSPSSAWYVLADGVG